MLQTQELPISAAWFGDSDTVAEFTYRLIDADHIELIAMLVQTDKASGKLFSYTLADRIVEAEFAEDEAVDIEYECRNIIAQMGVNGWNTGKFSENVAQAIDRAARLPAIAAE